MKYCIVNSENIIENIIVADESFADHAKPYYDGAVIGAEYNPVVPEAKPTAEEMLYAMLGVSRYE